MPVYSKLLSAVAVVALVVSGGAVNMNLRSNVARSAPFDDVGTIAGRPVTVPDERRPSPKPEERRRPDPVKDTRRPSPKPEERRRPDPVKDTRRPSPVIKETRPEPAGPTPAEIYQNKLKCNKGCKTEFKKKKESCGKGRKGKDCRNSNNANKQACLADCKA